MATGDLVHSQAQCGRPAVTTAYPTDWLTHFKADTVRDKWDMKDMPLQVVRATKPDSRLALANGSFSTGALSLSPSLHRWPPPCGLQRRWTGS